MVDASIRLVDLIILGVGAVVLDNNRILLVKRKNSPYKGYWGVPGGRVEHGERLQDAVKRELLEETGLESEPLGVLFISEILPGSCSDCYEHIVVIDFLVRARKNAVKPSSDAADAGFFDLMNPPEPLSKHTSYLINYLITTLKTSKMCVINP